MGFETPPKASSPKKPTEQESPEAISRVDETIGETTEIFERNQKIAAEAFEMAGFKVGDKVIVEVWDERQQKSIPQEGWEIVLFTTLPTKGRQEPAAGVSNPEKNRFDTLRLFEMNLANPTKTFLEQQEKFKK